MPDQEQILWESYKQNPSRDLLEQIVLKYLDVVHILANKLLIYTSRQLTRDDLYSAGVTGLLDAIERFDHTLGIKFKTFATKRIRGAIIDEIRKNDWVPRSVRYNSKKLDKAIEKLYQKNGQMPSDSEIAKELELSINDYYKLTDNLGPMFLGSIDDKVSKSETGENLYIKDVVKDPKSDLSYENTRKEIQKKRLTKAISELPKKEKLVIALYYYEDLTLKEIGKVLDVSESRICQIHSSALYKLKTVLTNNNSDSVLY